MENQTSLPKWLRTSGGTWAGYQLMITGLWIAGIIDINSLWFVAGFLGMAVVFIATAYHQRKAKQAA